MYHVSIYHGTTYGSGVSNETQVSDSDAALLVSRLHITRMSGLAGLDDERDLAVNVPADDATLVGVVCPIHGTPEQAEHMVYFRYEPDVIVPTEDGSIDGKPQLVYTN